MTGKEPFVTGSVPKSLHWEFWHGHRKWPYDTGSGCMSPEVAVCHRNFAKVVYRTVNRMLTGLVGLKKYNYLYTVVYSSKNSCSIPINTKTMTTICVVWLNQSHTKITDLQLLQYLLTAVVKVSIGGPPYSILNLREPKRLLFKEVSFICLKVQVWKKYFFTSFWRARVCCSGWDLA